MKNFVEELRWRGMIHDIMPGTEEQFLKQQEHDRRKREYALNNDIQLLEIWYYDFNNIEDILNKNILHIT